MLCRKGQNYFVNKTGIVRPGTYLKDEKSPQVFDPDQIQSTLFISKSKEPLKNSSRYPNFDISDL